MSVPWFDSSPDAYIGPSSSMTPGVVGPWGTVKFSAQSALLTKAWTFTGEFTGRHGTKIDWKPRMAKPGSTPTNLQRRQTEVDALIKILTPTDLTNYGEMLQVFRRFSNVGTAIGVTHPGLHILGVSHLYYTEGDVPKAPTPGQVAVFRIRFREWIQDDPAPAVSKTPVVGSDMTSFNNLAEFTPADQSTPQVSVADPPAAWEFMGDDSDELL